MSGWMPATASFTRTIGYDLAVLGYESPSLCPLGYVVVVPCARLAGAIDYAISRSYIPTKDETHESLLNKGHMLLL
jgi:hypothetical protein